MASLVRASSTKYQAALKFNSAGDLQWAVDIGESTDDDYARGLAFSEDGGYVIAGETKNSVAGGKDVMISKISGTGSLEWVKLYGLSLWDESRRIIRLEEGGYLVCGKTTSFSSGTYNILLMKID